MTIGQITQKVFNTKSPVIVHIYYLLTPYNPPPPLIGSSYGTALSDGGPLSVTRTQFLFALDIYRDSDPEIIDDDDDVPPIRAPKSRKVNGTTTSRRSAASKKKGAIFDDSDDEDPMAISDDEWDMQARNKKRRR